MEENNNVGLATEIKKTAPSLLDRASAFTEHKQASSTQQTATHTQQTGTSTQFSGKKSSPFWHEEPPQPVVQEKPKASDQSATAVQEKKVEFTYAKAVASADITTEGLDNLQKLLFNILENIRYKRKFKPADVKRIVEKELTEYSKFNELPPEMETSDKMLWKKWDNLHKKHQKKLAAIPMKPDEKKNMKQMFISIQEYEQKVLSPGWGIAIALGNLFGSRAIEIYMED